MGIRNSFFAALILLAAPAHAAPLNWTPEVQPVPVIPHGLDWSVSLPPDPEPVSVRMADAEIAQFAPQAFKLKSADLEHTLVRMSSPVGEHPIGPIAAILIGSTFLLAAYDLIPRIHSQVLRCRSVDFRQNLLS